MARRYSHNTLVEPLNIVSLLPSATEIICAVGARANLVGVSHECDYPKGVERLPVLTRPRRELPRKSGEIDRAVREMLEDALAIYEVDVDRLRDAAPQVIVTQDLCDVCAVSLEDVQGALRELASDDVAVLSLRPTRLHDVWDDVRRVAEALDRSAQGNAVATELEHRCDAIAERAKEVHARPSLLSIEWLDPVMIGGTWMPDLIALAGGQAMVTKAGQHAPTIEFDELRALDPDVVLVKPCGYDLQRTQQEADLLAKNLPWESWSAVREGRVFVADGNAFFNRPGPRLVESLEILAACLHPMLFGDLAEQHAPSYRRVMPNLDFDPINEARQP